MESSPRPLTFLLLLVSGWVNRQQQSVIDSLLEENRRGVFQSTFVDGSNVVGGAAPQRCPTGPVPGTEATRRIWLGRR